MTARGKRYGLRCALAGLLIGVGLFLYGYHLASPAQSLASWPLPSPNPALRQILQHPALAAGPMATMEELVSWSLICAVNTISCGLLGIAIGNKIQKNMA